MNIFRRLITSIAYALCAGFVFLANETWWIRHTAITSGFSYSQFVDTHLFKLAWKACIFMLLLQILLGLIIRYILKRPNEWNDIQRVFQPLAGGGIIALISLNFPVAALDAVAGILLPVTAFLCFVRIIGLFTESCPALRFPNCSSRQVGWLIVGLALAVHFIPWWNVTTRIIDNSRDYLLTGDQPAYLYMADSLVHDRDLDVSNNNLPAHVYHREDGRHAGGVERHNRDLISGTPAYQSRAEAFGEASYSTHRPGTSLLIAPLYFVGTMMGDYHRAFVCILLIVVTALSIRELFLAAVFITKRIWPCFWMCLGVTVSIPVAVMSTAIFPETFMFFIVARLIRLTTENNLTWSENLEMGLWLALAPWLQDKYVLWVLPFTAVRVYYLWPRWKTLVLPMLPVAVSALLMMNFNLLLFGQIMPKNTLGRFLSFREAILTGLPGIWFDWGFGLLMLAPIGLLALAGFSVWWKSDTQSDSSRATLIACLLTLTAGVFIFGTWWCWWGGFAPPNRFMLTLYPVICVLAMVATVYAHGNSRHIAIALWVLSVALGIDALLHPELWYTSVLPSAKVAAWVGWDAFSVRFPPMYPGRFEENYRGFMIVAAGAWTAIMLVRNLRVANKLKSETRLYIPALLFLILAGLPITNRAVPPLEATDIPSRVGIIRNAQITSGGDGTFMLEYDYFYRKLHGALAMGIHYLDEKGNVIGQGDFDLNDYRNDWIQESKDNRDRWSQTHQINIRRDLAPPQGTTAIRIRTYNPALAEPHRNQRRGKQDIIPLPI